MTDHNGPDDGERPSRTRRKREAEALQAIGERLLELPEPRLAQLPLPDALLRAVRAGRELTQRGAARRQRQYIGRLMRELDTSDLLEALAKLEQQDLHDREQLHAAEAWRDRLLGEGRSALEAFLDAHPHADRQRLRQLVQASVAEAETDKLPRHRRALFREIRHVLESGL